MRPGLAELFSGQTVLVTGAGGSIGSELCRQVARFGVARLVCVDVSEFGVYQLEQELRAAHPQMHGCYYTANVREVDRLRAIAMQYRPAVILHAAAYKHVPLMEELNEIEALRTNVMGTLHAARVAGECGARRFVMISTDKAVNPTNVMGASKRLAELMVQGVAAEFAGTQYVSVRFGNVLGSSGSVVPLFTARSRAAGPVTVTHPDIVRYFMTIPEAAQLVLQAGPDGKLGPDLRAGHGRADEDRRTGAHADPAVRQDRAGSADQLHRIAARRKALRRAAGRRRDDRADTASQAAGGQDRSSLPPDIESVMRWIADAGPAPASHVRAPVAAQPGAGVRAALSASVAISRYRCASARR